MRDPCPDVVVLRYGSGPYRARRVVNVLAVLLACPASVRW